MEAHEISVKENIQKAAWDLFRDKGYANTTVNEIIERAKTSKGGFYYYFHAKDELLNSLYSIFDQEYEKYYATMDKSLNCLLQLKQINQYVSYFIEREVPAEWLGELYRSQLADKTQENFLNPNRYYIQLLRKIISEGQRRGEIRDDMSTEELSNHILLLERGILMNWCVQNGAFSIGYFGSESFNEYIGFMEKKTEK